MNLQLIRRCFLSAFVVVLLSALSARGDTVIQPLSINGSYDLSLVPHFEQRSARIDLGIVFGEISSVGIRLDAAVRPGVARILGSTFQQEFSPLVMGTLVGDDQTTAAFGEVLLPSIYYDVLAIDGNWPPKAPDFSSLLDGRGEVNFSVGVPLMTANTAIVDYPSVNVRASALVVSGATEGRIAGDFDGDGAVYKEDYELFRRTFGQHVKPGMGADASGNGIVDAADYVPFRNHLGVSIRPTDGYLAGDFDYSGAVDAADYYFWKARFGIDVAPFSGADGNGSGRVDAADYRVWRDQLGKSLPGYSLAAMPVPEPTGILLLASAAAMLSVFRYRIA